MRRLLRIRLGAQRSGAGRLDADRSGAGRLGADRRGETALEFALVGGLFVLLLMAPIEIGLMVWTGSSLQQVAEQTARCAAIGSSLCSGTNTPQSFAVALAAKWVGPKAITAAEVSPQQTTGCNHTTTGSFEKVTITSSIWSGALIAPLSGATQLAVGCYPRS